MRDDQKFLPQINQAGKVKIPNHFMTDWNGPIKTFKRHPPQYTQAEGEKRGARYVSSKLGFFKQIQTQEKAGIHDFILSLCIQIVSHNIVNSRIVAHNKIKLKFHENYSYFDNA